jgi:cytochrome d ubiquinol oxidase subunit I
MERISAGRALMGDSLGFHLILIIFGVALPLLISGLELYGLITHRPRARALARTWSKALVVLFIAGAVSGTAISMQFNLVWPKFLEFINKPVGLAFALEGTAFMVEAVFLSVYMLSWDRFKPWLHWVLSIPLWVGSFTSAIFITSVNAFMNQPAGFTIGKDGLPTNINVAKAIFNPATFTEVAHSVAAYVCASIFMILALYAWLYIKPRHAKDRSWMKKLILGLAVAGFLSACLVGVFGDMSARYLARYEPYKLAAAEGQLQTQSHAPLLIGGVVSGGQIKYAIKVPSMLSFLATHNFGAEVQGLDKTAPVNRPPLVIHYFFDLMVLSGILLVCIPALFLFLYKVKPRWAFNQPFFYVLIALGPCALLATEFGWLLTELGRQPYIVHGYLKVGDALTTNPAVIRLGLMFPLFYVALLTLTVIVLRKTMYHQGMSPRVSSTIKANNIVKADSPKKVKV